MALALTTLPIETIASPETHDAIEAPSEVSAMDLVNTLLQKLEDHALASSELKKFSRVVARAVAKMSERSSMLTPIKSSIEKKNKFVIELSGEECCAFITKRGRGKQCSRKRVGAYCKHHEKSMAKDAMMAKDKALNCEKDATIAKLNRELELATANAARQATRNFEDLALQKMMVDQMDAMMGKLDTLNMSSASK
ncbi:hypothetical protein T492DRAFT_838154 [Pavlovales sp. CCMP2436]|nr:hypothetical protein T492DRAFT_838154 [Pavlovales sp. CCMP2436]